MNNENSSSNNLFQLCVIDGPDQRLLAWHNFPCGRNSNPKTALPYVL